MCASMTEMDVDTLALRGVDLDVKRVSTTYQGNSSETIIGNRSRRDSIVAAFSPKADPIEGRI
jgi:hypothetical protein